MFVLMGDTGSFVISVQYIWFADLQDLNDVLESIDGSLIARNETFINKYSIFSVDLDKFSPSSCKIRNDFYQSHN